MRSHEGLIGLTGSSGAVGSRVAARLAKRGVPQRLMVRDASRAPKLAGAQVVRASSYGDAEGMRRALSGVRTLFLVSAKEATDRVQQHETAVDAALGAGVERIVYLSFLGAAPHATFTFARHHFQTEEYVRATGLPHTFLRSSLYLDLIPHLCGPDGVIRGPAGTGRVAPIARDDIADVVEAVLLADSHDGQTYDMTGPESLTVEEIAQKLSRVVGRPIRYEAESLAEARASRKSTGAPDWEIEGWVTSYAAIATGEMDVVSDAVPRLSAHGARTVDGFLREHPESYQHLRAAPVAAAPAETIDRAPTDRGVPRSPKEVVARPA